MPRSKKKSAPPKFEFGRQLESLGYSTIVGIDEVGVGALAGPLVVAAIELRTKIEGVDDSKKLTDRQRQLLSRQIKSDALQVSIGFSSNLEIDALGLKKALALAYARALSRTKADLFLTDNYKLPSVKTIRAVHGESLFYPIAAASIVAKTYRDQLMRVYHNFFPEYAWFNNVGYGTKAHLEAIRSLGTTPLHRQSFLD